MSELHYLTITELAQRLEAKDLSPVEVTQAILDRIERLDQTLDCYSEVIAERALAAARNAADEIAAGRYRGPLHGVPVAIKDLCDMAGLRTKAGGVVLGEKVASADSTVVRAARSGRCGDRRQTQSHRGSDGGLPPELWRAGQPVEHRALGRRVVQRVGPLARSSTDAALMLQAIAGRDAADPTSLDAVGGDLVGTISESIAGLRSGSMKRGRPTASTRRPPKRCEVCSPSSPRRAPRSFRSRCHGSTAVSG